ncbi:MAG: glycosyltransferase family 2 protein [Acidobacteria bacterium]|nr:glycosyltransferase family 2 protein [Acidobacteriota bacterium]
MAQLPRVSILIPVYNEKESFPELHRRLVTVMAEYGAPFEIIYVNDGSTDGSAEVLDACFAGDARVQVIHFRRNFGKAAALSAGFSIARGVELITLDADLQDLPEEIPRFLDKLHEGYDLISGWKHPRRDPLSRRLASRIYNRVTRFLSGVPLHDMNCGFKAFSREASRSLRLYGELHRYIPVIVHSKGFRVGEIQIAHHPRRFGRSKYGLWRFISGFFDLITVLMLTRFISRPLHVFGLIGSLAVLAGGGTSLYLIISRLFGEFLSNRPLFYLALSVLIVGVQLVFFGLLAEMIAHSRNTEAHYSIREHKHHQPPIVEDDP